MTQAPGQEARAANGAASAFGSNQPRTLSVVHYGPDGTSVASTGTATCDGMTGSGAVVRYESRLAGGAPYASSSVQIDDQGRAQSAATRLLNRDGSPRKTVEADYGGIVYNAAGRIASGAARYAFADPTGAALGTASMAYADESYSAYALDNVQPTKTGAIGRLEIAFDQARLRGLTVIGGQLGIACYSAGNLAASRSTSFLDDRGQPTLLSTSGFASDGTTVQQVCETHYGGATFDARGRIDTGDLIVVSTDGGGASTGGALFRFVNGTLVGRWRIAAEATATALATIKPVASNDLRPVSPTLLPWQPTRPADSVDQVKRADGTLIEQRGDWYAPSTTATPWRSQVTGYAMDGVTAITVTDIDYRAAAFGAAGDPTGGTVITTRFDGGVRSSTTNLAY